MNIYKAIHMCIEAHKDQVRKLDNDIYAAHPIEVGILLAKFGMRDEVICAGILHDTVEDTAISFDMIERDFGPEVRELVSHCSEKDKSQPWKIRKIQHLIDVKNASEDVKFIICADKVTNIKSIHRNMESMGSSLWHRFNAGYDDQKWYYEAMLDALSDINEHELFLELEYYIHAVFDR